MDEGDTTVVGGEDEVVVVEGDAEEDVGEAGEEGEEDIGAIGKEEEVEEVEVDTTTIADMSRGAGRRHGKIIGGRSQRHHQPISCSG